MHKWKIEIILKCGKEVVGYCEKNETSIFEVSKEFICSDICALTDKDKKTQIMVITGEVAAITVSKA